MHLLDRPVWASLSTYHASLSEGNALARRFARDVNLFASACDDSQAAVAELATLVGPGESVYVLQVPEIVIPPGCVAIKEAKGVQMLATRRVAFEAAQADILALGDSDAPEMLALAQLTEPGPFLERTHTLGDFVGIRIDGRLIAMAGERMRFPGYTEVSGVCTHPEFRGRGFARRLSAAVAANITARGDQAFLHAWKSNHAAISLYEGLGFEVRTEVNVAVLKRSDVVAVTSNGPFQFPAAVSDGAAYTVSIHTQPANPTQLCSVSALTGALKAISGSPFAAGDGPNSFQTG